MDTFKRLFFFVVISTATACSIELPEGVQKAYTDLPEIVDFNFHIRPILSDKCYACHGPDNHTRKGDFRLDTEEGAMAVLKEGGHAFVSNSPGKSEAVKRLISSDPDYLMPPPESKTVLSDREIALIAKWIEQGAVWKEHWSFIPLQKVTIPQVGNAKNKVVNPIDNFVWERLTKAGLTLSEEADKERLLRRVTMDLTGLPPSLEEMDAFLADHSDNAYEKVVDRLLSSRAYAERMTMDWLDIARYADSHGFHADGIRYMWPWRDWVIDAFDSNMPYDKFVTTQLAGDLFENRTTDDILATGFQRNHPMTAEGGAIDEEFRIEYVSDRTNSTATAFLGLTMECARCHEHKFDPVSQKDYYSLSAFFNNIDELGMTGDDGNYGPMLQLMSDSARNLLDSLNDEIVRMEEKIKTLATSIPDRGTLSRGVDPQRPDLEINFERVSSYKEKDKEVNYADNHKEVVVSGKPEIVAGRKGNAFHFDNEYDVVHVQDYGMFEMTEPFSISIWINTSKKEKGRTQTILGNSGNKNNKWSGWDLLLNDQNNLSVRMINALPNNYIQVTTTEEVPKNEWVHVAMVYDGSASAKGVTIYMNGNKTNARVNFDHLYKSMLPIGSRHTPENRSLRIGKSYRSFSGENGIYNGMLDELYIFHDQLSPLEVANLSGFKRDKESKNDRLLHELLHHDDYKKFNARLFQLRSAKLSVNDSIREYMVMEERSEPRPTFVLNRGRYDAPMEKVEPGTPERILPFPDSLPKNRLGFAKWLFLKENPLTARVTVNRYWKIFFGKGIVKTLNDFGKQGALPTHPELLDWLSLNFMESGWDVKQLCKTIVMSATYRQSGKMRRESVQADPENILLSRGPGYRLPAEMIRDNALAASGLLNREVGGESVKPYQPEGLWIELGNFSYFLMRYKEDKGKKLYRRSMYTFIRRTSPPPYMTTFDAPSREVCTVDRPRTNTPLQALILLNDPQFVEASKVLAERMATLGKESLDDQITVGFRLATGRRPESREIAVLRGMYNNELERFSDHPKEAEELLQVGEYVMNKEKDRVSLAALTMVANTILNHDEAYMKR